MNQNSKRLNFFDYLVIFILIANSGFPFFTNNPEIWIPIASILSFILLIFDKGISILINRFFIITFLLLGGLVIGQSIIVENFETRTMLTLFLRWAYPLITIAYLGSKFPFTYVRTILFLTLISFLFYFPSVISNDFENTLYNYSEVFQQESKSEFYEYNPNILIYTIKTGGGMFDVKRNSGPFWEAGGFGAFLILALVFNLIRTNKILNNENIVFIIAILTTWSTASWIALFVTLFLFLFLVKRNYYSSYIYIPIIIFLAYISYRDIEIFNTKINTQVEYLSRDVNIETSRRNRIVSALADLQDVQKSPIFGLGRSFESRFENSRYKTYLEHRNNGVTDFLVKYGIPFFLFYFYFVYKGFLNFSKKLRRSKLNALVGLAAILIVGFSQILFQNSIFIALIYMHVFIKEEEKDLKIQARIIQNN